MVEKVLKAKKRVEFGSNASKRLRKDGFTPAVLYGKDFENVSLVICNSELKKFLSTSDLGTMVTLDIEGKKENAIVKEIQRTILGSDALHVDFQHVVFGEKLKVTLPVNLVNTDVLDKELIIQKTMDFIDVEALPKNLVEAIEIDVKELEVGSPLTVADINAKKYKGIEFLADPEATVVVLVEPTLQQEADEKVSEEAAPATEEAE